MDDSDWEMSGEAVRESTALLDKINHLERELDGATSKIMRLEGTADQITDTEIAKKVESLRDAIQQWVNGVEQDLRDRGKDFGVQFLQTLHDDDGAYTLEELGLFDSPGCGTDADWMMWLGGLSTCIFVVLCRHIWAYLEQDIFRHRYPVGVLRYLNDTFDDILDVMKYDGSAEGMCACYWMKSDLLTESDKVILANKWRSDTMRALVKTRYFREEKKHLEDKFPDRLAKTLTMWIGREVIEQHSDSLTAKIIHPAVHLQQQITCSSHEYRIVDLESPDLVRREIPDEATLLSWKLLDITKWRPIYGEIGGVFRSLYPAIYRRGLPGEEDVMAVQPVVLVYGLEASKSVPRPTRRLQPQRDLGDGQGTPPDSQRTPQRSPHRSPERPSQNLSGPPLPSSPTKRATPAPAQKEPASPTKRAPPPLMHGESSGTSRDHSGRQDPRATHSSTFSPRRPFSGKNTAKDEKGPGDRLSDSAEDHKPRPQRSKTVESSTHNRSREPSKHPSAKKAPAAKPNRPRRLSSTQGSTSRNAAAPSTGEGIRRARTEPRLQECHAGSQSTYDGQEKEVGSQRRRSGDDGGTDTFTKPVSINGVMTWDNGNGCIWQ